MKHLVREFSLSNITVAEIIENYERNMQKIVGTWHIQVKL